MDKTHFQFLLVQNLNGCSVLNPARVNFIMDFDIARKLFGTFCFSENCYLTIVHLRQGEYW